MEYWPHYSTTPLLHYSNPLLLFDLSRDMIYSPESKKTHPDKVATALRH